MEIERLGYQRATSRGRCCFLPHVEQLEQRCLLANAAIPTLAAGYGQIPLSFEANQGQTDSQVDFFARGLGYGLFLTPGEAVLSLQAPQSDTTVSPPASVLRLQLIGAQAPTDVAGLDRLPGISNYLLGNDPSQWRTNVPNYAKVQYRNVYPGIDLVYYGGQQQLEYDFTVTPGVDPGVIQLAFAGAQGVTLNERGELVLRTSGGDVVEHAPVIYQEIGGVRQPIEGHYVLEDGGRVGFAVGAYDNERALVIDPVLSYSTYLGGTKSNVCQAIAVDRAGNAYVTGGTDSTDFPTQDPLQGAFVGTFSDVIVTKLNAAGNGLVYSTYLGGDNYDVGYGIAVDGSGSAYVIGVTHSKNFPTTNNALQQTPHGAFIAKLNPAGTNLIYSTYLGGSRGEEGRGIAVDNAGDAYITGDTSSPDFPTQNPIQAANRGSVNNAFVSKLNPTGSALLYSTYLGGASDDRGIAIAIDSAGDAYVAGTTTSSDFPTKNAVQSSLPNSNKTAFVAAVNAAGNALIYSTYLGGSNFDHASAIAVDDSGAAYVEGGTASANFPTKNALQPSLIASSPASFVAKLNPGGGTLAYATYLGANSDDGLLPGGIAVDAAGSAYVVSTTSAKDVPIVDPLSGTSGANGASGGGFVARLNPSGSVLCFSTIVNSAEPYGVALDGNGGVYVTGTATGSGLPVKNAFQASPSGFIDGFILKISPVALAITAPSPATVPEGSAGFTITVTGPDFLGDATVLWNGEPLATTFVDGQHLQATVPAGLVADEGTAILSVIDADGASNNSQTFAVTDLPLVATGVGSLTAPAGSATGPVIVATFQDSGGQDSVANYSAQIDWGDGTAQSPATIGLSGTSFNVVGSHTYALPGTYIIRVGVHDEGGATALAACTAVAGTSDQRFLAHLYKDVLHRSIDPGGLAFWTSLLAQSVSRVDVAYDIASSAEYRIDVIQNLYATLLQRAVDGPGLDNWLAVWAQGGTAEQIEAGILDSQEYFVTRSGGTNAGFLAALYGDVLHRGLDAAGQATFGSMLDQGADRSVIAELVVGSTEAAHDLLQGYYQAFLHRGPEAGAVDGWTALLLQGAHDEQVLADIVGSQEYFMRS